MVDAEPPTAVVETGGAVARHPVARVAPPVPAIISASRARVGERDGEREAVTKYSALTSDPKTLLHQVPGDPAPGLGVVAAFRDPATDTRGTNVS
jgi:hypothetical protein